MPLGRRTAVPTCSITVSSRMPGPCSGRLPTRTRVISIALLLAALGAQQAHAGLFDDDEARRQVSDLQLKSNERLDTVAKGQMELANQIQALRDENARLRGQVETLNYELDAATKRQKDFYIDLDTRLRKLETPSASAASATAAGATVKPADDSNPASEAPRKVRQRPGHRNARVRGSAESVSREQAQRGGGGLRNVRQDASGQHADPERLLLARQRPLRHA
jgi:cell division protein FtsB